MRKLIAYFLSFLTIICCFTIFCIFLTEKTDLLGLKDYQVTASFSQENGSTSVYVSPAVSSRYGSTTCL